MTPHKFNPHTQLRFGLSRTPQPDRNARLGGRSFYLFDFDDNVMHLPTRIYVFHRVTGEERAVTTSEFARINGHLGKDGPWHDYSVDPDDAVGSFRDFRDPADPHAPMPFLHDLRTALHASPHGWKGPSWDFFEYATYNARPVSIITARGHAPETLKAGIHELVRQGHLQRDPDYLSIYPVSHPPSRATLGDHEGTVSTAKLKHDAIIRSVDQAMGEYGVNPHHRFGMSDDDAKNLELIIEAMQKLKARYPDNAFYVIDTSQHPMIRSEVLSDHLEAIPMESGSQLRLFG